ncbi:glycosyltransferase [Jannaschia sp. KMU-145]|uniref:glycosyltransferase n=1 Tax=Jannaschia halovivens TaxID=3388667 RepID=UPI00396B172E
MRICFVVSTFPARSQTFVTAQVLHALRAGHDVTVACRQADEDAGLSPDDVRRLEQVRRVDWPPRLESSTRYLPPRLHDAIRRRAERWTWRQIESDLVIAHFGYAGAAVARARQPGKPSPPLVTIFHGRDVSVEHHRNGLRKYRGLFAAGDLFLTVNEPFAELLVAGGAPRARVEVLHLGVPTERYAFTLPEPFGSRRLRFASVARLVPKKGLHVAIAALARLHRKAPELDWTYEIGGSGPCEEDLRRQAAAAGLSDRIRFLGPLSHQSTVALIADADAFLAPSITAEDGDQEGIPVTLMEAMALGTPVCTTRHSGIPELVSHGRTGLLSDEGDADALCDNLNALSDGSADVAALATAARRWIEREFDLSRQTEALFARCRAVMDRAHAGTDTPR